MQVDRGNLGTICEEQAIVMTSQEHVGTAAASSSNAGESEPSEWTCPGYGKIKPRHAAESATSGGVARGIKFPSPRIITTTSRLHHQQQQQ